MGGPRGTPAGVGRQPRGRDVRGCRGRDGACVLVPCGVGSTLGDACSLLPARRADDTRKAALGCSRLRRALHRAIVPRCLPCGSSPTMRAVPGGDVPADPKDALPLYFFRPPLFRMTSRSAKHSPPRQLCSTHRRVQTRTVGQRTRARWRCAVSLQRACDMAEHQPCGSTTGRVLVKHVVEHG